jgi:amidase
VSAHPNSLGPDIAGRYAVASKISRSEAQAAEAAVDEAARYFADLLDDAIIALPATSTPAIPLSATPEQTEAVRGATLRLTFIASAAGLPAVSLPVGSVEDSWQSDPLPVGLQLVGAPGVDRGLLELAAAVERTLL